MQRDGHLRVCHPGACRRVQGERRNLDFHFAADELFAVVADFIDVLEVRNIGAFRTLGLFHPVAGGERFEMEHVDGTEFGFASLRCERGAYDSARFVRGRTTPAALGRRCDREEKATKQKRNPPNGKGRLVPALALERPVGLGANLMYKRFRFHSQTPSIPFF